MALRAAKTEEAEHAVVKAGPQALGCYRILAEQQAAEERFGAIKHGACHTRRHTEDLRQPRDTLIGVDPYEGQAMYPCPVDRALGFGVPEDEHFCFRDLHLDSIDRSCESAAPRAREKR